MIRPDSLTDYNRTWEQLEELALFATLVAGKPARRMAAVLESMLANARLVYGFDLSPFEIVRIWISQGILEQVLRAYGTGQYQRLSKCWRQLVETERKRHTGDLATNIPLVRTKVGLDSIKDLERVHGIGPKTARLIVLHSVEGTRAIPLDTHWIKELRQRGYPVRVAIQDGKQVVHLTPQTYKEYEGYALAECDRSGMTCADYDLAIWRKWNGLTRQERRLAA